MIYSLASWPHYHDHIAPILQALPPEIVAGAYDGHTPARDLPTDGLWVVASHQDLARVGDRSVVYVEHGAGQSYTTVDPSYSGGPRNDAALYVCPRQEVADRWEAAYPGARTVVAGCPKLDPWHRGEGRRPGAVPATVAFTFHHDAHVVPEANSAWPWYRRHLAGVVSALHADGIDVLAHAHPRSRYTSRRFWQAIGARFVDRLADLFDSADLLVADNTSALPEFASLGRPVVWLNAPWYRRDVWHGGRFWAWPVDQVQVDHPADLYDGIRRGLDDDRTARLARARMIHAVYDHVDGHAADRAAQAIMEVHG